MQFNAINGQVVPYDGWVELIVTLAVQEDPNLIVKAPFLVSQLSLSQPLVGPNVLGAIIHKESDEEATSVLYKEKDLSVSVLLALRLYSTFILQVSTWLELP